MIQDGSEPDPLDLETRNTNLDTTHALYSTENLTADYWHLITAIYDSTKMFLYVDTTLVDTATALLTLNSNDANLWLGANDKPGDYNYFLGSLDEIYIYKRAISEVEIKDRYLEGDWPPPSGPQNLSASAGDQQIILIWSPNTDPDLDKYRIYRDTSSPAITLIDSVVSSSPPDTFYTDTGLVNGQIYYYRITAVDSAGNESIFSNEVHVGPTVVPDGLLVYYPFNGNALDFSGNEHDGTVYEAILTTDRCGNNSSAYVFDGLNDYIDMPSISEYSDDSSFTLIAWANTNINSGPSTTILTADGENANDFQMWLHRELSKWEFQVGKRSADTADVKSTEATEIGEWVFLSGIWNGDTNQLEFYLNGNSQGTNTFTDNCGIGTDWRISKSPFDGKIDEIRIYNRVLIEEEIRAIFVKGPPCPPQNLTAASGDEQISLTWTPNDELDLYKYRIYRDTSSPASTLIDSVVGSSPSDTLYTDTGLVNGQIHYYRITAVDSAGNESGFSNEVHVSPTIVWDGLTAYYPFGGHAVDVSGNGHDGTVEGATLTSDKCGTDSSAYSFDGIDDRIALSQSNLDCYLNYSVCAWVKTTDSEGVVYQDRRSGEADGNLYHMRVENSTFQILVWDNSHGAVGNQKLIDSGNTVNTDIWTYLVSVVEGNDVTFYVDGDSAANGTFDHVCSNPNSEAFFGLWITNDGDSVHFFDGTIDEARIYSRALSAGEIRDILVEGSPCPPQNLTAASGDEQISLSWSPNNELDLYKYLIYRDTSSPTSTLIDSIVSSSPPDTFYTDTSLVNGQLYYYRITAVDSSGNESDFSDEIHASPAVVTEGLIAYYPFSGHALDVSGNGHDGIVDGATPTGDKCGKDSSAYYFDGDDDYIDIPSYSFCEFSYDDSFSVYLELTADTMDFGYLVAASNDNNSGEYKGWGIHYEYVNDNSDLRCWIQESTTNISDVIYDDLQINTWYSMTLIYNGLNHTMSMFINNALVDTGTVDSGIEYEENGYLHIGNLLNDDIEQSFFEGSIDEVRFYDRILSEEEIKEILVKGPPCPPQNLSATAGDEQIAMNWSPNEELDLHKYMLYRGTSSPASTLIDSVVSSSPPDTFYTDTGLVNGQIYYYRITAVDSAGNESNFSDEVHAGPTVVPDGLLAYYPFSGNALDYSGNEFDGTVYEATLSMAPCGNTNSAYAFDGDDDWIDLPYITDYDDEDSFTLIAWAKTNVTSGTSTPVITADGIDDNDFQLWIHREWAGQGGSEPDRWEFQVAQRPSQHSEARSVADTEADTWVFLTGTWNGDTDSLELFVNAVSQQKQSFGYVCDLGSGWKLATSTNSYFNGSIDEVRIYDRVLSTSEIRSIYTQWFPNPPENLTGTAGDEQISLTWSPNIEPDLDTYRIYRDTFSPASTLIDSIVGSSPPNTFYTDTGLTNGQLYHYRITAVDSCGYESDFSNEVHAGPTFVPDGLIAYYPFDDHTTDFSGNGNDGINYGAEDTTGLCGAEDAALHFDSDKVIVENHDILPQGEFFSVNLWARFDLLYGDYRIMDKRTSGGSDHNVFKIGLKDLPYEFFFMTFDTTLTHTMLTYPTDSLVIDEWYMVTAIYDSTKMFLYLNNTLIDTATASLLLNSTDADLWIGANFKPGDYNYFKGSLDEIRIYGRALSEGEVAYLYDHTAPDAIDDLSIALHSGAKSFWGNIHLSWTEPFDCIGVDHYVIHRSTDPLLVGDSIATTAGTEYLDLGVIGHPLINYYYAVKAVDAGGNTSLLSNKVGEFDKQLHNIGILSSDAERETRK
jgi:fibronectin type 3 domain-containing protein